MVPNQWKDWVTLQIPVPEGVVHTRERTPVVGDMVWKTAVNISSSRPRNVMIRV